MTPLRIANYTYTSCLGMGRAANWDKIRRGESGLTPCDFHDVTDLTAWIGRAPALDTPLPEKWSAFDCRNNRLAWLALQQDHMLADAQALIERVGAARVGVFLGTSTSGIYHTEQAYLERRHELDKAGLPEWYSYGHTHNIASVARFVQTVLGTQGPCMAISTACSSSAKVFASAERAIRAGLCDAAIVGGVDSLCLTTLYGFHALQLVSPSPCAPFDKDRSGISIGEAGGFALLEKSDAPGAYVVGYGESGDAYHMSSPHPEGEGAATAMEKALATAGLAPADISYINLHGTGTQANDSAEACAVQNVFGNHTPASSTKGWTGHTLGAAGIVEIGICLDALHHQYLPPSLNLNEPDSAMTLSLIRQGTAAPLAYALSNSFGFGGSNCSVVVGVRSC